ncbi:MAG: CoA pyrophosphatase [Alphaproteobacteria bacterium]|nr:CoA pyrophosphatase [Alphaproteobacteria bacterium]
MSDILARLRSDPLAALRAVLLDAPSREIGHDDYDLHPELRPPHQSEAVGAAVLLPIVMRDEPSILFTQRTETLARHSGQVSFPGGRADATDLSPVETALRETREETGIDPAFVRIAGYLPRYRTGTGYDISPVVGVLSGGFTLAPNPDEVAEAFEAPLAFFLDPANRRLETRLWGGRERSFYVFTPQGRTIWGATAAILVDFAARLNARML